MSPRTSHGPHRTTYVVVVVVFVVVVEVVVAVVVEFVTHERHWLSSVGISSK